MDAWRHSILQPCAAGTYTFDFGPRVRPCTAVNRYDLIVADASRRIR